MQAFRVARTELLPKSRPNVTQIFILITDGEATREAPQTIPEATKTKNEGVEVFSVGITSEVPTVPLLYTVIIELISYTHIH